MPWNFSKSKSWSIATIDVAHHCDLHELFKLHCSNCWDFLIQPIQWIQRILKPETFGCANWAKILISSMKMPSKSLVISPEVPWNTHGRSQRAVTEQWLAVITIGWFSKVADHRDDGKKDTHGGATIQDTLCKYCLGSCINKETKQHKIIRDLLCFRMFDATSSKHLKSNFRLHRNSLCVVVIAVYSSLVFWPPKFDIQPSFELSKLRLFSMGCISLVHQWSSAKWQCMLQWRSDPATASRCKAGEMSSKTKAEILVLC